MQDASSKNDQDEISAADRVIIESGWVHMTWLPAAIIIFGLILSSAISIVLYLDISANFEFINNLQRPLPWLALAYGLLISLLLAILIRAAQVTRRQAKHLEQINQDLQEAFTHNSLILESKQKLEHALLQGQKLQAMGTLAGGIAHDFNNILYAIIGYTEMAREDVEKESQLYQNLGKVLEACQRGQELVARILTFSRRQQHKLDVLSLKSTIEAALSLLKQTIPASVQLDFLMNDDFTVYGNKTLLHQVLVNLINNAVDAMDGEGTIVINVERVASGDSILEQFPDATSRNYCKIEITDSGHGMDNATMERIFEPFFTTKEVGKGTGLGLSIVHSIIKEHKGEVTVNSELGKGTTFTILLPESAQQ